MKVSSQKFELMGYKILSRNSFSFWRHFRKDISRGESRNAVEMKHFVLYDIRQELMARRP